MQLALVALCAIEAGELRRDDVIHVGGGRRRLVLDVAPVPHPYIVGLARVRVRTPLGYECYDADRLLSVERPGA
jgi:hypothetical protein